MEKGGYMKKTIAILLLGISMSSVVAADLFQNNNPFPQTTPEKLNNIYESEPATIQQEVKQEKKSWFKRGKNLQEQEVKEPKSLNKFPNEGVKDGSFYIFK